MGTENTFDLAIPPALADQLRSAAEEQHRSADDVVRDAVENYLRAWRPLSSVAKRSPLEAAARMMRARKGRVILDDSELRDLISYGRA